MLPKAVDGVPRMEGERYRGELGRIFRAPLDPKEESSQPGMRHAGGSSVTRDFGPVAASVTNCRVGACSPKVGADLKQET